jgi:membrane fusion protein, multidrug efflux system
MNPFGFVKRRFITRLVLLAVVVGVGVLAVPQSRDALFPRRTNPKLHAFLDRVDVRAKQVKRFVLARVEAYTKKHEEPVHHEEHRIVVSSPESKAVTITEQYVCQIHSQRHIEVRALEDGYLETIAIKEGQAVKKGDVMFTVIPTLYQARLDAELAEAQVANIEYLNTEKLFKDKVVSQQELMLLRAKLTKAQARAKLAGAELGFTSVKAPFDGIVDRQHEQLGSLVKEGSVLTTLSDNSVMWVYFNVPEKRYLEYMAGMKQRKEDPRIELVLANGDKFQHPGKIGAIEANFNNETGNIPFRADFPNPDRLLRHGQTGNVVIRRKLDDAVVIPQRATFEILDKRYVYVVDKDNKAHQREIVVGNEMDDIYVIKKGVDVSDRIVLEGIRQVHDGAELKYEFRTPELVMANLKNKAE